MTDTTMKRIQLLHGTKTANDAFVGRIGEVTVNTTGYSLRIHDGETAGGHEVGFDTSKLATVATSGSYNDLTDKPNTDGFLPITGGTLTGDLSVTGSVTATADVVAYSDARLKIDVKDLEDSLEKVLQLRGVSFRLKEASTKTRIGFIAQETKEVVPEVVTFDGSYYGISYGNIVALLVEAIKEQQKQIDELKSK